jgi:hypothetical protein
MIVFANHFGPYVWLHASELPVFGQNDPHMLTLRELADALAA